MNEATRQEYEALYLTQFDRLAHKVGRELGNYMDGKEAVSIAFVHQLLPTYPCYDGGDGQLAYVDEVDLPHSTVPR